MVFLRSTLFQILFYLVTFVPDDPVRASHAAAAALGWWVVPTWSRVLQLLMRVFAGIKVEVRGRENLPDGGFIAAMKHQSAWETVALIPLFRSPTFILKRELRWIPIFGWYTAKFKQIPINRGKRSEALAAMMLAAKEAIAEKRQILIFPEGTRRPPGRAEIQVRYRASLPRPEMSGCPDSSQRRPLLASRLVEGLSGHGDCRDSAADRAGPGAQCLYERMVTDIETASDRLIEEARTARKPSPVLEEVDTRRKAQPV